MICPSCGQHRQLEASLSSSESRVAALADRLAAAEKCVEACRSGCKCVGCVPSMAEYDAAKSRAEAGGGAVNG